MKESKRHTVLNRPDEYEITDFQFRVDHEDSKQSFIRMTLKKDAEFVTLLFWQPINLIIEEGFPRATGGMVFNDVSGDGLEDIGVEVADTEATLGSVTFLAKSVERIQLNLAI